MQGFKNAAQRCPTGRHKLTYPDFPPHMLAIVIQVAVIAPWRARMPSLRNSDASFGPYLGLASEAGACRCFATQSHRKVRVSESQRDVM